MFKAFLGGFTPLSGETGYQMAMPTLIDFANELNTNRDWLGRPIRPENPFGDYGPKAYKEFNASAASSAAAGMPLVTTGRYRARSAVMSTGSPW
ncbi:MAG: LPD38 domain-containing protein [Gaiellales bacterium]